MRPCCAVLLMNVCQGICLGQQNALTPLTVFAAVGIINVAADVALVAGGGLSCATAGMVTAAVQWAGALAFVIHLYVQVRAPPQLASLWCHPLLLCGGLSCRAAVPPSSTHSAPRRARRGKAGAACHSHSRACPQRAI